MSAFGATGVVTQSITRTGLYEPFDLQASRGQITGHIPVFRGAYTALATAGQNYAVWNRAANYVFPSVASKMFLSSDSTADTTQSVFIQGLDANYNAVSEVIALNGQAGVQSSNTYYRINGMIVVNDSPVGNLYFGTGTITSGVPANVYGFISAGDNNMLAAIYTVPAGYTLYITGGSVSSGTSGQNKYNTIKFYIQSAGVKYAGATITQANGYQYFPYNPPLPVGEKTDLLDTATTTDATPAQVSVNLTGYLVKNEGAL